jgi:hypothetical protein
MLSLSLSRFTSCNRISYTISGGTPPPCGIGYVIVGPSHADEEEKTAPRLWRGEGGIPIVSPRAPQRATEGDSVATTAKRLWCEQKYTSIEKELFS